MKRFDSEKNKQNKQHYVKDQSYGYLEERIVEAVWNRFVESSVKFGESFREQKRDQSQNLSILSLRNCHKLGEMVTYLS